MRTRVPGLVAAAAIVAAGCGGSAGPGAAKPGGTRRGGTIVAQLKTAMRGATSVHLAGQLRSDGSDVDLDVSLIRSGNFAGLIESGGTKLDIVAAGQDVYIKVTSAFLKLADAPAAACTKACGKYVSEPVSAAQTITGDLSMRSLLGNLASELPGHQE